MRCVLCGGRDYTFETIDTFWLDSFHKEYKITECITGGASGADNNGHFWAVRAGIDTVEIHANWEKYGKKAGFIRNKKMLYYLLNDEAQSLYNDYEVSVIAFKGGDGTAGMVSIAKQTGVKIYYPLEPINEKPVRLQDMPKINTIKR